MTKNNYGEINPKDMKKLHEVEVEILDEIVRICNKYKISYFLTGGSALGAVRHKGFIPWDDDVDLGMSRKDYDLFIQVCLTDLNEKYYLQCFETDKNYWLPFAKIRKKGTLFVEKDLEEINSNSNGIFVDVIPFENVAKQDSLSQKIQAIVARNITDTMFYKKKIREIKNCRHPYLVRIFSVLSCTALMKIQKKVMTANKNDESDYIVALAGTYGYQKETMERNWFFPVKGIMFEGKEYNIMNSPEKYLNRIFGNYMKLPPKDKRINHEAVKISFGDETK